MLKVNGKTFSATFKSVPSWLGESPSICYLVFDTRKLKIRAATGLCLMEYTFDDVTFAPNTEKFTASVNYDAMAGMFKGLKDIEEVLRNE